MRPPPVARDREPISPTVGHCRLLGGLLLSPAVGGRALPRLLPLVVGGTGNMVLYVVIGGTTAVLGSRWLGLAQGRTPTDGMSTAQVTVLAGAYAPALVWPVALTVALIGYARR